MKRSLWKKGQAMVEYILILVLVSLVAIGIFRAIGTMIAKRANQAAESIKEGEYKADEKVEVDIPDVDKVYGVSSK